jgi:predicted enzyme related to lactoylglutathione lyase
MTLPITYIELNSPDLGRSTAFLEAVFGWAFQPFVSPEYLVAPGAEGGVDTGLLPSRDGAPRAVPVIRVPSLAVVTADVVTHGGAVVVPPFTVPGVGRGCYVTDPSGLLIGLHEYDTEA